MVILRNLEVIECGVEICPMASMLPQMSTGIGAFEQVAWDLEARGIADIDIPVLILGIEPAGFSTASRQDTLLNVPTEPEVVLKRYENGLTEAVLRLVQETKEHI